MSRNLMTLFLNVNPSRKCRSKDFLPVELWMRIFNTVEEFY